MKNEQQREKALHGPPSVINKLLVVIAVLVVVFLLIQFVYYNFIQNKKPKEFGTVINSAEMVPKVANNDTVNYWKALELNLLTDARQKEAVDYGKELIAHTAKYLGPKGLVLQMSNGLNCQNCHLQAGTAVFANNYGSVASLYPKFRARSGQVENIYKRVNDCFERSLNGKELDTASNEMKAIVSYIYFIGGNVAKGIKAAGSGFKELAYLDRAADPEKGKTVYTAKCQVCHQPGGGGVYNFDTTEFTFPALWGNNSFNDAAGLYRISNFAKYVKYNMPQGVTHEAPQLTDEEAWDVAAFVTTRPRPHFITPNDWPDISKKPVDHPFGPYSDAFTEKQHKLGPFKPIEAAQAKKGASAQQKTIAVNKQ